MHTDPVSIGKRSFDVRVVDASQHRVMPWKNGLGTTAEIAIDPPDAELGGRFRWRLSVADVRSSGPFSAFPGYDRTIMVIEGRGMDLIVGDDAPRRVGRLFAPLVFSGDARVECRLIEGPIRDFNVMVDRSRLHSRLDVWRNMTAMQSIDLAAGDRIIHCFGGSVDLVCAFAAWTQPLRANQTAVFRQDASAGASVQAAPVTGIPPTLAVITLMPLASKP
jgi:environmental stress-induced protein Ves